MDQGRHESDQLDAAYLGRGWRFPPKWAQASAPGVLASSHHRQSEIGDSQLAWMSMQRGLYEEGDHAAGETGADRRYAAELAEAVEDIREAIHIILGTRRGERVMHPDFGCDLEQYVFETMTARTMNLISTEITRALTMWERRIKDVKVEVTPNPTEQGRLDVSISYEVETHRLRQSLIYPFYVNQPGGV